MTDCVAAVDCGSNSTRLLIADDHGTTVARATTITRLSHGVDASNELVDEAIERSLAVLRRYRDDCDAAHVTRGLLVATSAVRDATNGEEFVSLARDIIGFDARILSGDEEAAYSLAGAAMDLSPSTQNTVIVDVGGGSTEVAARVDGAVVSFSMQLGCVRVAERALGHGVVDDEHLAATNAMIEGELDRAFLAVPVLATLVGRCRMVGLAGTVATLAQLDAGLEFYDRAVVHHRVLTRSTLGYWRDLLGRESPTERLAHPGMVLGREDVLVAGLLVLDAVMERFRVSELLSSENDILDGIVAALRGF